MKREFLALEGHFLRKKKKLVFSEIKVVKKGLKYFF
jgi:hypothetical protein